MGRATTGLWSFNGGEVSPRMHGRLDQSLYPISCETMLGWMPTVEGAALALPGSWYVETAAGPCRLIPFEYNVTQGYAVEASAAKFRFYTNDVRLESSPGVPVEVAHPYTLAELRALDYQQSADVLYLAGGGRAMRTLSRTGASTFVLALADLEGGPIGDGNSDETLTLTASATTGAVTLTSSAAMFAAGDVGSFLEIEAADFSDVPSWETGITTSVGAKRTWAGKVYECMASSGRTGTAPPEHDAGEEWDGSQTGTDVNAKGPFGCRWKFLHGRYGLVKLTAVTLATSATATVIDRLADSVTTVATWRWAFGAFSDTRGWPETVALWNDCLVMSKDNRVYTSVIGDLLNHRRRDSAGDFQRDLAGQFTLPNPAKIQWTAADRLLLLGTEKGEFTVERILTQTGIAGPPVFDIRLQSTNGSAKIKPVQADGKILFVQRAGRKLMEMGYSIQTDRYDAPDMTRLAEHIGRVGFVDLAWGQEPERVLWGAMGDGSLSGMTYSPGQQVMGWFRRALGDGLSALSACRITDPDGKRDQIWLAASFGSSTYILRMAKLWETGDDPLTACFTDAAIAYSGVAFSSGAGAEHLVGQTVQVLADGKAHPDIVIGAGGSWAIDYAASNVVLGLGFPAEIRTLPIEAGASEGTAQTKLKRIVEVRPRVLESGGLTVQVQDGEQLPVETRVPDDAMDAAVPLFSGDLPPINTIGSYERQGQVSIIRTAPLPSTLLAIVAVLDVGEM